jgi:hypothetical protein
MPAAQAYVYQDSCVGGCIRELHYLMGCLFFTIIVINNFLKVYKPVTESAAKEQEEREGADPSKQLSQIEKQFMLMRYHQIFGSFEQFKTVSIQFGYAILFSVAFPLAPALAWLSTYFGIRVDAWVLLQKSRRVIPTGAEDIGSWQTVFEVLAGVAVIGNMGTLFVVSSAETNTPWMWRQIYLLLWEHGIFMVQLLFAFLVDDVPAATTAQLGRQTFLHAKLIDNEPDDDPGGVEEEEEDEDEDFIDDIYDQDEDPAL